MNQTTFKTNFYIETDTYHGPFELVLELIEKRKLLVNDLSLASITDDFITHIHAQKSFPVEETAYFIGIAATLLLIKSKSLIPEFSLTEEESEDVEELKRRLVAYEYARNASQVLGKLFGCSILISRGPQKPEVIFSPSADLSIETVTATLIDVLKACEPVKEKLSEVRVRPIISIEEMMSALAKRVQTAITLSFREFSGQGKREKIDVVVSFLALLELVKQGAIEAAQSNQFDDIRMTNTTSNTVPNYSS